MNSDKIRILCIIPARSGSKGVPGKNIASVASKPLIEWSIMAAKNSKTIDKIIISTDSEKYKRLCRKYDVEVPFIRPKKFASDTSTSEEVVLHAVKWFKEKNSYIPEYILYLQPTSPLRSNLDIDNSIEIATKNNADSVLSVTIVDQHPYYMKRINSRGQIAHYQDLKIPTPRRQELEKLYILNGAIFLVKTKIILNGSWYGEKSYPYVMPSSRSVEIDSLHQLKLADILLSNKIEY